LGPLVGLDLLARRLAFEAERRDRPGHQALEADRLAALLALIQGARLEALHGLADLREQERLAIVQAELGRIDLLLGPLVHRIAADPIAIAIHRELERRVRVVPEAIEIGLESSSQLLGLLRRQHGFSLRMPSTPSIKLGPLLPSFRRACVRAR